MHQHSLCFVIFVYDTIERECQQLILFHLFLMPLFMSFGFSFRIRLMDRMFLFLSLESCHIISNYNARETTP